MEFLYSLIFICVLEFKTVLTRKSHFPSSIFRCPQSSGLFLNPDDCTKFYQCDHNIPYSKDCPKGTVFNENILVCDWLRNVPRCQDPMPETFICPHSKGVYRNPVDCKTFYNCWAFRATLMDCSQGLYFNDRVHQCDWPNKVPECNEKEDPVSEIFNCPRINGHFRNPIDCTSFYSCSNYHATLDVCPQGFYYSEARDECDQPKNVPECNQYKDNEVTQPKAIADSLKWLSQQRNSEYNWGSDTPSAIQIYQFVDRNWFNISNLESQVIVRQFHIQLLVEILRDRHLQNIPINKLAMDISALIGVCGNPYEFYGVNLVSLLKEKMASVVRNKHNYEADVGFVMAVITLCQYNITIPPLHLEYLVHIPGRSATTNIDIRSLVVIALSCIKKQSDSLFNYNSELKSYSRYIWKLQADDGSFPATMNKHSRILSTSLAAQALLLTFDSNWSIDKVLSYLKKQQKEDGSYAGGIEILHKVVPVMNGLTLLDINSIHCYETGTFYPSEDTVTQVKQPADTNNSPTTAPVTHKTTSHSKPEIYIKYTIIDNVFQTFNISKYFSVPSEKNMYTILQVIAEMDERFEFEAENTALGHVIKSVYSLEEDKANSNYWFVYRKKPGEKRKLDDSDGLDSIYPVNNEEFTLIYEHFVFD